MTNTHKLVNYLRAHRKTAGLSQSEVGAIIGYSDKNAVGRHELFRALPPFLMGIAYEVLFHTPVSELFPGVKETVEIAIERSLAGFETALSEQLGTSKGRKLVLIQRKLDWIKKHRRDSGE